MTSPCAYPVPTLCPRLSCPQEITIDDRIPCERFDWFETPSPLFARNNGAEMYVMLLEKAFAKIGGSYECLKGGSASRAWVAMTGCVDVEYYEYVPKRDAWLTAKVKREKLPTSPLCFPMATHPHLAHKADRRQPNGTGVYAGAS